MSSEEVTLWFIGLFLLIGLFGCLDHLICETLELVTVLGLVLSQVVENTYAIQKAFKFTRSGSVLLVTMWPFHGVDGTIRLPLLIVALGRARLVRVARLLLLLSVIEGRLLHQGIFVGDSQYFF
jgi:hypothetical protein